MEFRFELWRAGAVHERIELSANYGVEFYTANNKTNYKNAPVSVLDLLALKRFKNGWGVGVVGGSSFSGETGWMQLLLPD